jgi:beta-fructofuranosidase
MMSFSRLAVLAGLLLVGSVSARELLQEDEPLHINHHVKAKRAPGVHQGPYSEHRRSLIQSQTWYTSITQTFNYTDEQARGQRPMFHITPPFGWMNDPNGMFELNGTTHVFYQHTPEAVTFGVQTWGHVISRDLAHWKTLPTALVPDTVYDESGCFSGSATIVNGTPTLLYTGTSRYIELGYYFQQQAKAYPLDLTDPELINWVKDPANPFIAVPPSGDLQLSNGEAILADQFRDPTTAFQQDGLWYTAVGVQPECVGAAALYTSPDFSNWTFAGTLASQISVEENTMCIPNNVDEPQICPQKGTACRTWECPDFWVIDGVNYLKYSDQIDGRTPYGADWYVLSNADLNFASPNYTNGVGIYEPILNGAEYGPNLIDYGAIYASKHWQDTQGRLLWLGWAFEASIGCDQQCSEGTSFTNASRFQGAQTIPRVVTFDPVIYELVFYPVPEVEILRNGSIVNTTPLSGQNATGVVLLPADSASINATSHQFDIEANFTLQGQAANQTATPFTVGIVIDTGNDTSTTTFLNGTATSGGNQTTVTQLGVYVDKRRSGAATNSTYNGGFEGGPVTLPPGGIAGSALQLRALVDHSIIEAFAQMGRGRVTSRVYPLTIDQPWIISVFGNYGTGNSVVASTAIYEMEDAMLGPDEEAPTASASRPVDMSAVAATG